MDSIKKIIIVGSVLIFLVILSLTYFFIPKIEIVLNGKDNITLLIGETYTENGANAYLKNIFTKEELNVDIDGTVNSDQVGKYIITYKTKSNLLEKEVVRVVNVVDDVSPQIKIQGDVLVCEKNKLIEYNVTATDNYDNDITDKLKYKLEGDEILFSVVDSSNNKTEVKQPIKYIDNEKPQIELNGKKSIYLMLGSEYEEEGAKAHDSCDGDITSDISIEHEIDTNTPGKYEVLYSVVDTNGNKTTKKRYITVIEQDDKPKEENKVVNKATIYLTFDDGPGPYTEELLKVLDEYDIKVTFFVTGQFEKYRHLIKEAHENGHAIGIHTYTHKWSIYRSVDDYLEDFNLIDKVIYEETGIHTKLFRFPGGSSNTISRNYSKGIMTKLSKLMQEKGYIYFDWTFDSGDTSKTNNSKESIIKNMKANLTGDGDYVVLMHDIKKNTIDALPEIIEYALANNYTFEKLTEESPTEHFKIAN